MARQMTKCVAMTMCFVSCFEQNTNTSTVRTLSLHKVLLVQYLQMKWEYGKREREEERRSDF
jgi:hypothetical protein